MGDLSRHGASSPARRAPCRRSRTTWPSIYLELEERPNRKQPEAPYRPARVGRREGVATTGHFFRNKKKARHWFKNGRPIKVPTPSRAPGFLVPSTHFEITLQHRNRSPITAHPPTSNTPLCFLRNPPRCAAYPTHRPQNRRKHCAPAVACAAPQALRIFSSGSAFFCAAPVAPRPPVPSSSLHSGGRGCCRRCLCRCSSCTASVAGRLPLR